MGQMEQADHLRSFVQSVQHYYIECKFAEHGAFSIPKAMVLYALAGMGGTEKNTLLDSLADQELIVGMDEQKITFSETFLAAHSS